MGAILRVGSSGVLLGVAAALAFVCAPLAQAAPVTIAGFGEGAGRVDLPRGVAVDQSNGELYVADSNNFRIDKFDSEGDLLLAWGWGVADGKSQELQVCGPAAAPPTPRCFHASANTATGPGAVAPEAVAVDQSNHDVYVADTSRHRVSKFSPAGEFLYMVGKGVNQGGGTPASPGNICTAEHLDSGDACGAGAVGSGPGEFTGPRSLAVDPEGRLWVVDGARIVVLDSFGSQLSAAPVPGGRRVTGIALELPGRLYVLEPDVDESQTVSFEGFAAGNTFTLEGLPAPCSASATAPIEFSTKGTTLSANIGKALVAKCGNGNVSFLSVSSEPPVVMFGFRAELGAQDFGQLNCAVNTGGGSCMVATLADGARARVAELEPVGNPPSSLAPLGSIDEAGHPSALALAASGDLYVGDATPPYRFMVFDSTGKQLSQFGAGQVIGAPVGNALALDEGAGKLYTASSNDTEAESVVQAFPLPDPGPLPEELRAEEIFPTEATLRATLNPEGASTEYRFEYLSEADYLAQGESFEGPATVKTPEPDATLPGTGFDSEEIEAQIEALVPETTYRIRLLASNENGVSAEEATFTTLPAVGIEAQWASDITARSAKLHAQIDPLGPEAEWWLEYGTSPCSEGGCANSSKALLPAGFGEISVAIALSGLAPDTAYHYRFSAEDEREGATYTVHGEDRSFTTQPGGLGFDPADSRAWEMVSPQNKFGARIATYDGDQGGHIQAAAGGDALAYLSYGSIEGNPEGSRLAEQSSALARRGSDGSWSSEDISPPHTAVTPFRGGTGLEYRLFSTELERVLLEPRDTTPLSPGATERTPYLRYNTTPRVYEPLVTAANVPPETPPFGGDPSDIFGAVSVRGASAELDHVAFSSTVPLASEAASGSLYLWSGGALEAVSVLPEGEAAVQAQLGSGRESLKGAISADGSRVFWTANGGGLYLRDTALDETTRLDEVQEGGFGIGAVAPTFQGASADGSVALFTDARQLTEDSSEAGRDLYRCEVVVEEGALDCELTDITAETKNPADPFESADVQGLLSGMSKDGSRTYFVAHGVLDKEPNDEGENASPEAPNLYAWNEADGVRFIATLAEGDSKDWAAPSSRAFRLTAAASPSGRYLAFMSELPLTGYDNRDATSGEPAQEVFRYDAKADELTCVSCNPSGVRPRALRPGLDELSSEFDPQFLWGGVAVAAVLPEATTVENEGASLYRPRAVHDNGRVFFNAADSLVGADSNGNGDVYQYEPLGVGSCKSSSGDAGTARIPGGCVSLISSGAAEGTAAFLDASEGGSNVFFYTPAQLSITDEDHVLDIYDARTNGIKAKITPIAECLGEACQPPTQAPGEQTPGSLSFVGPGNLEANGSCAALSRRSARLSRKAKRLRRRATRLARKSSKPQRSHRLRQRSARLARNARALGKRARRCRRG